MHRIFCLFVTLCITISGSTSTAMATDTTPPSVPTGLQAFFACGDTGGSRGVTLTWNPSTDTGGSGLAGYRVYRGDFPAGTYWPSPTTTFLDSSAALLTTYSYTVSAYDGAINVSAKSEPATITTLSCAGQRPVINGVGNKIGKVGRAVTFDASQSYDPDGHIVSYLWDFGDGTTPQRLSQPVTSHTYNTYGSYTVKLTLQDDAGLGSVQLAIVVGISPEICIGDGFCWENPGPVGNGLTDIWAFSSTDILASGDDGTLLHYDGASWNRIETNTKAYLGKMWASGPNDVWFSGGFHWDGSTFRAIPELTSYLLKPVMWGTSSSNIWIPLQPSGMVHFDGVSWSQSSQLSAVSFRLMWGTQGEIFALSTLGLYHYAGGSWSLLPNSLPLAPDGVALDDIYSYYDMWGSSLSDIWIVGAAGRIRRWNGVSWSSITAGGDFGTVWGTSSDNVWVCGQQCLRWNGVSFFTFTNASFDALGGMSPNDIWGVSSCGTIRHWNGVNWSNSLGFRTPILNLWSESPTDVWAAAQTSFLHWDGSSLSDGLPLTLGTYSVFGFAANDIWAAGRHGSAAHFDGQSWTQRPIATNGDVTDVWGASSNDLWAAARGVFHWNGSSWSSVGGSGSTIWGAAPNRIWTGGQSGFGDSGFIAYYNGTSWVSQYSGPIAVQDIWGSSENDAWAVGQKNLGPGAILHYNGNSWSEVAIPSSSRLFGVWGQGPNDVWAVGSAGTILHFDGSGWQSVDTGLSRAEFFSVTGNSSELWVGGMCGAILRKQLRNGDPPTISSSSPPNGFIDPLEDRDATTGALYGVKDVSITFSAPVKDASSGGALISSNFTLSFTRNSAPATDLQTGQVPSISSLIGTGAGPYTLHLTSRIPLGAWTKITAQGVVDLSGTAILPTGNSIVLGFLPMDVTQDGKVLGEDINRWLAIKNGSYPLPATLTPINFCDQTRDGSVLGNDITRAVQLINGTPGTTLRAWNGFDMGAKP